MLIAPLLPRLHLLSGSAGSGAELVVTPACRCRRCGTTAAVGSSDPHTAVGAHIPHNRASPHPLAAGHLGAPGSVYGGRGRPEGCLTLMLNPVCQTLGLVGLWQQTGSKDQGSCQPAAPVTTAMMGREICINWSLPLEEIQQAFEEACAAAAAGGSTFEAADSCSWQQGCITRAS